jgi:hypothetical protein
LAVERTLLAARAAAGCLGLRLLTRLAALLLLLALLDPLLALFLAFLTLFLAFLDPLLLLLLALLHTLLALFLTLLNPLLALLLALLTLLLAFLLPFLPALLLLALAALPSVALLLLLIGRLRLGEPNVVRRLAEGRLCDQEESGNHGACKQQGLVDDHRGCSLGFCRSGAALPYHFNREVAATPW